MTQRLNGITRPPEREYSDPEARYNDFSGREVASSNLGATQIRGQALPRQTLRKTENDIPQSSINGLVETLAAKEDTANKGAASGYAPLDAGGDVPLTNLPLPLTQANTHASPDTDSAPTALHHTLGGGANQAAAGNHTHTLTFSLSAFTVSGGLSVGGGVLRLPIDGTYTIVGTRLMVNTAPVGADIIVDVNKNGTTIYTTAGNRPRIVDGANAGGPGAAPDITTLSAGDYLTIDIDQVGSGTAGSNLTVSIVVSKQV